MTENSITSAFIASTHGFKHQLITIVLMSSLEEIKKLVKDLCEYIKSNYHILIKIVNYLLKFVKNKKISPHPLQCKDSGKIIKLSGHAQFYIRFYTFITTNPRCYCEDSGIDKSEIVKHSTILNKSIISKFVINYKDMRIVNMNSLIVTKDIKNDIIDLYTNEYVIPRHIDTIVDFMSYKYIDICKYIDILYDYAKSNNQLITTNEFPFIKKFPLLVYDHKLVLQTNSNLFFRLMVILELREKHIFNPDVIIKISILVLLIFVNVTTGANNYHYFKNIRFFDNNQEAGFFMTNPIVKTDVAPMFILDNDLCKLLKQYVDENFSHKINESNKDEMDINLYIENYDENQYKELLTIISELPISDKIIVNQISIKTIMNVKKVKDEKDQIEITYEVVVKQICTKYRDINTVYLQEEDKFKLLNILSLYKKNKETFISLGLQDKLGVLLHGLPGTGKTSCINAIASYLGFHLAIVDMSTVKTNEHLSMIFDKLNSCCENTIAVFEDIDVMTDVVLNRESNGELTLSHFLNLLDGSLTKDGTIFIVTTNHKEKLDPAFVREGRFNVDIEMKLADHFQCGEIFKTFFKRELSTELLELLPEFKFSPAKFIFYLARYIYEKIEDKDLIENFIQTLA